MKNQNIPIVSIVIPCFNDAKFIATAVKSLTNGTKRYAQNFEIVIVNDGSTDDSEKVIKRLAKTDSRIKFFSQENQGSLASRFNGAKFATGKYLMFLDADDEYLPGAVDELVDKFEELENAGQRIEYIRYGMFAPNHARAREQSLPKFEGVLRGTEIVKFYSQPFCEGAIYINIYIREFFIRCSREINCPKNIFRSEDLCFTLIMACKAKNVYFLPKVFYKYNFGLGQAGHHNTLHDSILNIDAVNSFNVIKPFFEKQTGKKRKLYEQKRKQMIAWDIHKAFLQGTSNDLPFVCRYALSKHGAKDLFEILLFNEFQTNAVFARFAQGLSVSDAKKYSQTNSAKNKEIKTILLFSERISVGGLEKVIVSQAKTLCDLGYRVILLTTKKHKDEYQLDKRVFRINLSSKHFVAFSHDWNEKLKQIIKENKVDLLWNHSMYSVESVFAFSALAKVCGIKSAITLHSFCLRFLGNSSNQMLTLQKLLPFYDQTFAINYADIYMWQNLEIKISLLSNPVPCPCQQSKYLENDIGKTKAKPLQILWPHNLLAPTKNISDLPQLSYFLTKLGIHHQINVYGRFGTGKVVPSELKNWKKVFFTQAKEYIAEQNIKIFEPVLDLKPVYKQNDIFIMTSAYEGFPLTYGEAASNALPIVMYDLPYLPLSQNLPSTLTVPFGDTGALAEQIAKLVQNKDVYNQMSKNILKEYAQFFELNSQEELLKHAIQNIGNDTDAKSDLPANITQEISKIFADEVFKMSKLNLANFAELQGVIRQKDAEISGLRAEIGGLQAELNSHLSIKRSAKLTAGNIKRRLKYGKNR